MSNGEVLFRTVPEVWLAPLVGRRAVGGGIMLCVGDEAPKLTISESNWELFCLAYLEWKLKQRLKENQG